MHIPDGPLSPTVCAVAGAISLGAVGYSLHRLRDSLGDRTVPLTGMMSALVFAGQMINFPVGGGVSGHLIGGVLAGTVLGPWAGCLALTVVLIVQCALFGDGGMTTLGANILHMGVIGSIGGYAVYSAVRRLLGKGARGTLIGAVVAAWLSVMAAAALLCVEFRFSLPAAEFDFKRLFVLMVSFHSLIGIGEALITGSIVSFVLSHRPDLLYEPEPAPRLFAGVGRAAVAGTVFALAVVAFLAPFASASPDGMEAATERTHLDGLMSETTVSVWSEYRVPRPMEGWRQARLWEKLSVSLAGLVGTLAVLAIALILCRSLRPRSPATETSHAE